MATAQQQARFRAKDTKVTIQVRLSPAAVAELDRLVTARQASGRAEILESILVSPTARDALTIAARHLRQAGIAEIHGTDQEGAEVEIWRRPPRARWCG